MKKIKIAFDFDDTLAEPEVQEFARQLMLAYPVETWVVTARVPDDRAPADNWNTDLWEICEQLGVPKDQVIFTSFGNKHEFFWDKDFLFHLDDDYEQVRLINALSLTYAFNHKVNPNWKTEIIKLLNETQTRLAK